MARKDQYTYGRMKEQKLAEMLRKKGASVRVRQASRGPGDMEAKFSTGRKWLIEVKSSRSGEARSLSSEEKRRLNQAADRKGATPVLARVTRRGVEFKSTRSDRRLSPSPRTKRGK